MPALLKAIAALHQGNLNNDDITVLLFRPNGAGTTTSFFTRLLAPFRIARALLACLFFGGPAPWPDGHPANMGGALISPLNRLWRKKDTKR